MEEDLILKKADLILSNGIKLREGFDLPVKYSISTAGPSVGKRNIIIESGDFSVKVPVVDESDFELIHNKSSLSVCHCNRPFLDDVRLQNARFHAPKQAFFNISQNCKMGCRFCSTTIMGRSDYPTPERIADMIREPVVKGEVKSVSFTGSINRDVQQSVDELTSFIREIHSNYPELPIGVECYVESESQIIQLKESGASEIKINIECATSEIMQIMCPKKDHNLVISMLEKAVSIFGKGKVCSNLIYGLGESDKDLFDVLDMLSSKGVMTNLRAVRMNDSVSEMLKSSFKKIPVNTSERAVSLLRYQEKIFTKYNLDPNTMDTMCFPCGCCDLIPFFLS